MTHTKTQTLKRLPVGIQTFADIREGNYLYIDKTDIAEKLINQYKVVFLSRPRRFGKSLFLSTLHDIFAGRKELFTGLAIEHSHEWDDTYPVIRLDMSGIQGSREEFLGLLTAKLQDNEKKLGLSNCEDDNVSAYFHRLIHQAYEKYGKKVVILIDEYDKPMLDNINKPEVFAEIRDLLQGFYVMMKQNDSLLRFVFLTGVSKFSKVSVFSGLNNLTDISLNAEYATVCGYTQGDIERQFIDYLDGVNLDDLKEWYNGYQFNGEPVYNPFDILLFITNGKMYSSYWFETATPAFLMKLIRERNYFVPDLSNVVLNHSKLGASSIDKLELESLLLQTGYLTIDKISTSPRKGVNYQLKIPNKEVRMSLAEHIIMEIANPSRQLNSEDDLYTALETADMVLFQQTLTRIFATIPYHLYSNAPLAHYEGYYSVVIYSYLLSLGVEIELEKSTNKGRLDMVVDMTTEQGTVNRYLIEFKMLKDNNNAQSAIEQIKEKEYFQSFMSASDNQNTYLVGICFDEAERNLAKVNGFEWERYST